MSAVAMRAASMRSLVKRAVTASRPIQKVNVAAFSGYPKEDAFFKPGRQEQKINTPDTVVGNVKNYQGRK